MAIEQGLQPLTGKTFPHRSTNKDDGARLDVKAQNFWDSRRSSAFFDVRVFKSHTPSNCKTLLLVTRDKTRANLFLWVENGILLESRVRMVSSLFSRALKSSTAKDRIELIIKAT